MRNDMQKTNPFDSGKRDFVATEPAVPLVVWDGGVEVECWILLKFHRRRHSGNGPDGHLGRQPRFPKFSIVLLLKFEFVHSFLSSNLIARSVEQFHGFEQDLLLFGRSLNR